MNKQIVLLRGIAILGVLIIHTTMSFRLITNNALKFTNLFVDLMAHYGVPLFIFLSGYTLTLKYQDNFSILNFYIRRFKSVIPQYILSSLIFYILPLAIYKNSIDIKETIYKIFTFNTAFHFWFFFVLIQFYLMYPFLYKSYINFSRRGDIRILLLVSFLIQLICLNLFPNANIFLKWNIYFFLGMYFSLQKDTIFLNLLDSNTSLFFIACIAVITAFLWNDYYLGAKNEVLITIRYLFETCLFCYIILLFFIKTNANVFKHKCFIKEMLEVIGKYSFGIYLIHIFYVAPFKILIRYTNISINDYIYYPLLFIFLFVMSLASVICLSKLPYSSLIIGRIR